MKRLTLVGALAALVVTLAVTGATAAGGAGGSSAGGGPKDTLRGGITDRPGPLAQKQRELVSEAVQLKLKGEIAADAKVAKVGKDKGAKGGKKGKKHKAKFVELERTGEDTIWSVLLEFGTDPATHNHGDPARAASLNHGGTPGPLHNQIAQPDRTVDNTTIWAPDFSKSYYDNLLFSESTGVSSMREFYIENSSGRYAVNGDVTDWHGARSTRRRTARTTVARSSACVTSSACSRTGSTAGTRRSSRPARRPRRSTRTCRNSTSGTGTTTTGTATSTSRTATSTTSRRSMLATGRRPAAVPRAPTRSGAIARTPSWRGQGSLGPRQPGRWCPDRRLELLGGRLHDRA